MQIFVIQEKLSATMASFPLGKGTIDAANTKLVQLVTALMG